MYDDLVARLDAIGEEEMYQAPATTRATIEEAMAAIERLQAELAEAVAKEREACAKVADGFRDKWSNAGGFGGHSAGARIIAAAIRERSNGWRQ